MLTTQQKHVLEKDGRVFIPEFLPNIDIVSCGKTVGKIVSPITIKKGLTAETFETLIPKHEINSNNNTYSSIFGLGEFPYHTDLAHSPLPPKYLLLRCVNGSENVKTKILKSKTIFKEYDYTKLKKCIFKPRDKLITRTLLPLPLIFDNEFIRWDSVFLLPANKNAENFQKWMSEIKWDGLEDSYSLSKRGDTLIINNWMNLHSRSSVSEKDRSRIVERIYLSEIWK
ncbi:hypothetical protein ACLEVB_18420 [Enterobacter ludwigii]|uniref:hypothetical protein n=1 Tax=Enterobacter ludwigii TaxID=299767 RepID=UPI0032F3ADC4|nr:hypothetical protein [Enterobacter ludwigii]